MESAFTDLLSHGPIGFAVVFLLYQWKIQMARGSEMKEEILGLREATNSQEQRLTAFADLLEEIASINKEAADKLQALELSLNTVKTIQDHHLANSG